MGKCAGVRFGRSAGSVSRDTPRPGYLLYGYGTYSFQYRVRDSAERGGDSRDGADAGYSHDAGFPDQPGEGDQVRVIHLKGPKNFSILHFCFSRIRVLQIYCLSLHLLVESTWGVSGDYIFMYK